MMMPAVMLAMKLISGEGCGKNSYLEHDTVAPSCLNHYRYN